ncbi:MAG: hemerythrin domain-containing protein [Nitrospira sp. CG24C]|mgnify:FL=1|nr:MAG: hemerythrin domain-containing protein [Nitrospira sp. CG24C]
MKPGENKKAGLITDFLVKDHGRLEGLLESAVAQVGSVDQGAYDQFRAGLLRHIGMEEKILLPAAQRIRGGEPLPIAAKLRLDHGAIASLLMPPPTAAVIAKIRAVLDVHNTIEEGPGGLYETCDELASSEAAQLLAKLQAAPELAVLPCSDSPAVMPAVQRALERAGYDVIDEKA